MTCVGALPLFHSGSGGTCTFCGDKVPLSTNERLVQQDQEAAATGDKSALDVGPAEASDAAVAFKNRLVDYDRNSSRRTTVIDDQVCASAPPLVT